MTKDEIISDIRHIMKACIVIEVSVSQGKATLEPLDLPVETLCKALSLRFDQIAESIEKLNKEPKLKVVPNPTEEKEASGANYWQRH